MGWAWLRSAAASRLALAGALAACAGYQVARPLELELGAGLLPALLTRDVYPSEGDFRWTRARSQVVFRDPGPGLRARVEARVAGWRPRGESPPRLVLRVAENAQAASPGQGTETVSVEAVSRGVWSSDLAVSFDSDTFVPGGGDSRALGVRLYSVRVVPEGPALALRRPPLRQVVATALAVVLAFGLLLRLGWSVRRALTVAVWLAAAASLALAFARLHATLAIPAISVLLGVAHAVADWLPGSVRAAAQALAEGARALGRGARLLRHPGVGLLVVAGALGVGLAYGRALVVDIPVGGGREALFARGFARSGGADGVSFRQTTRGAQLDLRDLGGGSPWRVAVTAAATRDVALPVVEVAGTRVMGPLSPSWTTLEVTTPSAPVGWRSGLTIDFPAAAHPIGLRIARVRVQRDSAIPALRVVSAVVASGLLAVVACGAAGLASTPALAAGGLLLAAEVAALALDPVLAIPFSFVFLTVVAMGAALAGLLAGLARVAERRGLAPLPPPAALAAAAFGFVFWLSSMLSPLYRGGNFVFHSSVAEEIWHGAFMTYYLPYPGSMLSHQAQWGNVLVPHPFLYQLLVAPLAALPQPWFYRSEKAVLALMLSALALIASLLASHAAGARAGTLAAIVAVAIFPSYLLLGLGHLMTLFGCLALSLALAFLILRFERLGEPRIWWTAVALLTVCLLSYTASLVFGVFVLGLALPFLWRERPSAARALVTATLAAGGLAFVLYYAAWTWPFLRDSVPRLLAGAATGGTEAAAVAEPLWPKVARIPSKLADSYGSALVPLAGLAGLLLLKRSPERALSWSWAALLVVFSGLDVFFNFLLKHHYATMVPVALGLGLLLDRLASQRPRGGLLGTVLLGFVLVLGVRIALDTALGLIP